MRIFFHCCLILLGLVFLSACAEPRSNATSLTSTARPLPTLRPTIASAPSRDPLRESSIPDSGWIAGNSGVELRKLQFELRERRTDISIVRLDLGQVRLRVGYAPGRPQSLGDWAGSTAPLLVVNGSFFDEAYRTTALLVSDGAVSGESYQGFGGMLAVADNGEVTIQPLRDQPYDPGQALEQAMQSFPMLVFPGGASSGVEWNGERDRRTALALDRTGRLLVIACPQASFSLNEFAAWLQQSDLEIDRALNLDGGASTALYVNAGAAQEQIEPFSRLPIVLFAEKR